MGKLCVPVKALGSGVPASKPGCKGVPVVPPTSEPSELWQIEGGRSATPLLGVQHRGARPMQTAVVMTMWRVWRVSRLDRACSDPTLSWSPRADGGQQKARLVSHSAAVVSVR